MELDHDTGDMVGEVLSGPLRGRILSSLTDDELQSLHSLSSGATDQSRALFESWLDRVKPNWRQNWSSEGAAKPSTGAAMSREEALAVLGLKPGASADDVRAAHRRLMKDFHPDHGGTDYIAAKINQAKDILVQD
jgi:DnaJ-domain-containing protein 1